MQIHITSRIYIYVALFATLLYNFASGSVRQKRDDANPITVTTILEEPYVTAKTTHGTTKYEGLIPEMMEIIAEKLKLDYQFKPVEDQQYGSLVDGRWTGMIGELISRDADMAAAPITISEQRKSAVDFTEPFENFGTVLLMLKDKKGSIEKVGDLADQEEISYGIIRGGVTENFFKTSSDPAYRKMWETMQSDGNLLPTIAEGVQRVRDENGKFAFIMESAMAEYWVDKAPCDLDISSPRINQNSFAFALKKGDDLLEQINTEIKAMHDNGTLMRLRRKYKKGECNRVIGDDENGAAPALGQFSWILANAMAATGLALREL